MIALKDYQQRSARDFLRRCGQGDFVFRKHYFGPRPGDLTEKKADGSRTAEMRCAEFLDGLPEVETWVRNLSRRATSFRLQTSKDWFYPDFVCLLKDGRILVVEYKGDHLWDDTQEKRDVGAVWESRSDGKCIFVMPRAGDMEALITQKISGDR
jgi:type III restriction enzyme